MKFRGILGCIVLLLFFGRGIAGAAVVTLVNGKGPSKLITEGSKSANPIVLTFGDDKLIIHDSSVPVDGKRLTSGDVPQNELFLIRDRRAPFKKAGYESIYSHKGFHLALVEKPEDLAGIRHLMIKPVKESQIVTQKIKPCRTAKDPMIKKVIARLNEGRYRSILANLAGNTTSRYACSSEVDKSVEYIKSYFQRLRLETMTQNYTNDCSEGTCKKKTGVSIIAIQRGRVRPNDFVLVGAHYDSMNEDAPCGKAPGANDDGSGVAGVMELAKVFSGFKTEATIVYAAFGGEEEDLFGSRKLANSMAGSKPIANLKASKMKSFVDLDMISYYDQDHSVLIEGSKQKATQKAAVNALAKLINNYTNLDYEISWDYGDADHEPFLDKGMPGAMIIEAEWEDYPGYHSADDTMDYQDMPFAIEVLSASAAMMATGAKVIP